MKRLLVLYCLLFPILCFSTQQPLDVNKAFHFSSSIRDPNTLTLQWEIKPGYFLYKDRFHFDNKTPNLFSLGKFTLPKGKTKIHAALGNYQIYRNKLKIYMPILGKTAQTGTLLITYQGCADSGFCYPPTSKRLSIVFNKQFAATKMTVINHNPIIKKQSELETVEQLLNGHNAILISIGFFVFGLLLSFTPCVLPMLPILSGIIIGQGKIAISKAFRLSLTYVLSMSLTYAIIGLFVAMLGYNLQIALQNPWVISIFAGLFILLAFSMFGFYHFTLPSRFQIWFSHLSKSQTSGTYFGVAIMGCLSTLILSPCVTPPLVGALSFIANAGNILLGGLALFSLGLGMGIPLLLITTTFSKVLPKVGAWMNTINILFGILLLAVAITLISRIIPNQVTMVLWAILFVISSMYMGALRFNTKTNWGKLSQGIGLLMLVYGILLLIGASTGKGDLFQPLAGFHLTSNKNPQQSQPLKFQSVKNLKEVKTILAREKGKRIILDFYADWCVSCKVMEQNVFTDEKVIKALSTAVLLKVDVTKNTLEDQTLEKYFNVIAPPTFIFFGPEEQERKHFRLVGNIGLQKFLKHVLLFNNNFTSATYAQ